MLTTIEIDPFEPFHVCMRSTFSLCTRWIEQFAFLFKNISDSFTRDKCVCVCARAGFSRLACLLSIEAKSEYCICKFQFFNSKQILCIYVVDFLSYSISSDPVKKLSRMNGDILHRHSHQTLSLHFPFRPQFSSSSVWLFSFSLCSNRFSLSLYAEMARINSY